MNLQDSCPNKMDGGNGFAPNDSSKVKSKFKFGYSHGPGGATGSGGCDGGGRSANKERQEAYATAAKSCGGTWNAKSLRSDKGIECFVKQMLPGKPLAGFTDIEIDNSECFDSGKDKMAWLQKIAKLMDEHRIPCNVAIVPKNFSIQEYTLLAKHMTNPSTVFPIHRVSNFTALESSVGISKARARKILDAAKINVAYINKCVG